MDKVRAFLAVDFAAFFEKPLIFLIQELQREYSDVKWVRPEATHVTLHFFGEIDKKMIPEIIGTVEPLIRSRSPFELGIQGIGAFPGFSRPNVLWAGLSGDTQALIDIKHAIDSGLEKIGIPSEKREYHPHLTLGRIRSAPWDRRHDSTRLPDAASHFTSAENFNVERLTLFQSNLEKEGPVYAPLHAFNFLSVASSQ